MFILSCQLLCPLPLQLAIRNLLLLEDLNESLGGTLFDIHWPRQVRIRESGDIELGIAMRERGPRALNGWHLRVEHLTVTHGRGVAILVLQQLHPFADLVSGRVTHALPLSLAVYWKGGY